LATFCATEPFHFLIIHASLFSIFDEEREVQNDKAPLLEAFHQKFFLEAKAHGAGLLSL
jgi:hypothetical protein